MKQDTFNMFLIMVAVFMIGIFIGYQVRPQFDKLKAQEPEYEETEINKTVILQRMCFWRCVNTSEYKIQDGENYTLYILDDRHIVMYMEYEGEIQ